MKSVCIIGLGLIGGSIARDIKSKKIAEIIYAYDTNSKSLDKAIQAKYIDIAIKDFNEIKKIQPSLIIVATPIISATKILLNLSQEDSLLNTIITDTSSTKDYIYTKLKNFQITNIVLSHPMTGSHNSGVDSSLENLFNNKKTIILNPFNVTNLNVLKIEKFWQKLGSQIMRMNTKEHDFAVAYASHLPHIIAFALMDAIDNESNESIYKSSAGSLKEFLRIAASEPEMWADIIVTNRENILKSKESFTKSLEKLLKLIHNKDRLRATLEHIKKAKEKIS